MFRDNLERQRRGVLKNFATVYPLGMLGLVAGFAMDLTIARKFGLGVQTDSFFAAYTIPQLVFIVSSQACSVVFVPIFATSLVEFGDEATWQIFSICLNWSLPILGLMSLVGFASSRWLVTILVPGFDSQAIGLASQLAQIIIFSLALIGLAEIGKSMLNALDEFAIPALIDFIKFVCAIVVVLIFSPRLGIVSVAYGYLAGYALGALAVFGMLAFRGFRYYFTWDWKHPALKSAKLGLTIPTIGIMLRQSIIVVERVIASFLPPGSISAITYARRVLFSTTGTMAKSLGTSILPSLSEQAAIGGVQGFKSALIKSFRVALFVSMPATVLLFFFSQPIVEVLFQRGSFTAANTQTTATALAIYGLGSVFIILDNLLARAFYAQKDFVVPAVVSVLSFTVTAILNMSLVFFFGYIGIPSAYSLGFLFSVICLMYLLNRRIGRIIDRDLFVFIMKLLLASLSMSITIFVVRYSAWRPFANLGSSATLLREGLWATAAGLVFLTVSLLFNFNEARHFSTKLLRKARSL